MACHPGALLHQDHKKVARVPSGGGHRVLGRERASSRDRGDGYNHLEVLVDDASRLAFVAHVPDERPASAVNAVSALEAAAAFYAAHGLRIERILTDYGGPYRSRPYAGAGSARRPPQAHPAPPTTDQRESRALHQDARPYRANVERLEDLPRWLHRYNHGRPHTALGGRTPHQALVNDLSGNHN